MTCPRQLRPNGPHRRSLVFMNQPAIGQVGFLLHFIMVPGL
jgi:hypothetical protein